ncbi:MAG: hypothetical protein D6744_08895, partial [Planctomycetota bacterium]
MIDVRAMGIPLRRYAATAYKVSNFGAGGDILARRCICRLGCRFVRLRMGVMSQAEYRAAALRFITVTIAWITCLFAWVALLTFDAADAPSQSVWPPNARVANLCGPLGAQLAFTMFYYLGVGAYALLLLVTAALAALS